MYESIAVTRQDHVGIITLDAPKKRNPLSPELTREYAQALRELHEDDEVRVVILTSSGPAFSAGGDLAGLQAKISWTPHQNRRYLASFYRSYMGALQLDVPTIAAINGDAVGAGLSITLTYDIRIASATARLGATFLNLGLHPGMATTHLLPIVVGEAKAAELIFTGKLIDGIEAARIGLVNEAVADNVLDTALAMANEIARKPPGSMRMAKRALVRRKLAGLEAALDYETSAQMSSYASEEMRGLVETMIAKTHRKPTA